MKLTTADTTSTPNDTKNYLWNSVDVPKVPLQILGHNRLAAGVKKESVNTLQGVDSTELTTRCTIPHRSFCSDGRLGSPWSDPGTHCNRKANILESEHEAPRNAEQVIALTTRHPDKQKACGFS